MYIEIFSLQRNSSKFFVASSPQSALFLYFAFYQILGLLLPRRVHYISNLSFLSSITKAYVFFHHAKAKECKISILFADFLTAPVFPFGPTDMNIHGCYLCLASSPSRWVLHSFSPVGDIHDCFRSTSSLLGAHLSEAWGFQPLTFFISHKSFW